MKVVYLYDGTPYLAYKREDGEYDYPNDEWTEIAPPEGIYSPFYFNGEEWIGSTKEEYESLLPGTDPYTPAKIEKLVASMQLQLSKSALNVNKLQKSLSDCMLDSAKKDERIKQLEDKLAQAVLEISQIKNENKGVE